MKIKHAQKTRAQLLVMSESDTSESAEGPAEQIYVQVSLRLLMLCQCLILQLPVPNLENRAIDTFTLREAMIFCVHNESVISFCRGAGVLHANMTCPKCESVMNWIRYYQRQNERAIPLSSFTYLLQEIKVNQMALSGDAVPGKAVKLKQV